MFKVITADATSRHLSFSDLPRTSWGEGAQLSYEFIEAASRAELFPDAPTLAQLEGQLSAAADRLDELRRLEDAALLGDPEAVPAAEAVLDELHDALSECEAKGETVVYPYDDESFDDAVSYHFSGPAMNYFWPLSDNVPDAATLRQWAGELVDLPVCLVVLYTDGYEDEVGLALTGGGMWLGDRLAEAYARLGFAVPQTIASDSNFNYQQVSPIVLESFKATLEYFQYRVGDLERVVNNQEQVGA